MPENDEREPTEKEQQERFEKITPKDKMRTRKVCPKTPKDLANFLISFGSYNAFLTGVRIKNKFPDLRMSAKRINEFMKTKEFAEAIREQIPERNKQQDIDRFFCVYDQYFEGQMQLKRGSVLVPDAKALEIFGVRSGLYNPTTKPDISVGIALTEDKLKEFKKENEKAFENRMKRLLQEKKQQEGGGNGE